MSRLSSYLSTAARIIDEYEGEQPFSYFIKSFFSSDKKYGSKDRKSIASLCYGYFRLGKALNDRNTQERILNAMFICTSEMVEGLEELKPGWNDLISRPAEEKMEIAKVQASQVFPFTEELSPQIDKEAFCNSHLRQPDLFIRCRPGESAAVKSALDAAGITYHQDLSDCIRLENGINVDKIMRMDEQAVVQDLNSQQVLDHLSYSHLQNQTGVFEAWDCCAASGGKSILLYDRVRGNVRLTVSDVRENILHNLHRRFQKCGISNFRSLVADLEINSDSLQSAKFDVIICDVPCSGSGTWGRTPEQLIFFKAEKIRDYADRQRKIVGNVSGRLNENGLLFYITCSVFKQENEAIVEHITSNIPQLKLISQHYLKGYDKAADTMFVAVFSKVS